MIAFVCASLSFSRCHIVGGLKEERIKLHQSRLSASIKNYFKNIKLINAFVNECPTLIIIIISTKTACSS